MTHLAKDARVAADHPVPAQRQDHLRTDGLDARKPSFRSNAWDCTSLRFAGLPLGHEFTSLVLALLWTGGHPPKVEQEVIDQIKALLTVTSTSRST
jgi:alkyl hydroperoxide reductase subunit AhpF